MGSPVSVIVADLVMECVEERALRSFRKKPRFWKRYVDDTLTVVQKDVLEDFHRHLNSVEPSVKFTVETEADEQIPFLDVLVIRNDDGSIDTTVYRKPTHTGRYLNFYSDSPRAHLEAVVRSLFQRADTHCSNTALRTKEES